MSVQAGWVSQKRGSVMKNTFKLFGIAVAVTVIGLSLSGCVTPPGFSPMIAAQPDPELEFRFGSGRVGWSAHPPVHASEYEVIGAIVIRNVNQETLVADLMSQAIAMGGHDIINVRIDTVTEGGGRNETVRITTASAVVIRYVGVLQNTGSE